MTDIQLSVQGYESGAWGARDLAKGAGGKFRYLFPRDSRDSPLRITEIALIRRKEDRMPPHLEPGTLWHAGTLDINSGRGGDYLFLVWKMEDQAVGFVCRMSEVWCSPMTLRLLGSVRQGV